MPELDRTPSGASLLFRSLSRAGLAVAELRSGSTVVSLSPVLQVMLGCDEPAIPVSALVDEGSLYRVDGRGALRDDVPLLERPGSDRPRTAVLSSRRVGSEPRILHWELISSADPDGTHGGGLALVVDITHSVDEIQLVQHLGSPLAAGSQIRSPWADVVQHVALLVYQGHQLPPAAQDSVRSLHRATRRLAAVVDRVWPSATHDVPWVGES